MPTPIPTNQYDSPYGRQAYIQSASLALGGYKPFNGFPQPPYAPSFAKFGTIIEATVASAPADLSTFIVAASDGASYTFQFVRAGSVPSVGIPVAVPAGGGTAAQTATALLAAINAGSGVETGTGRVRYFPFKAVTVSAAVFDIYFTTAGFTAAMSGTQATITFVNIPNGGAPYSPTVPGRVGGRFAFMGA